MPGAGQAPLNVPSRPTVPTITNAEDPTLTSGSTAQPGSPLMPSSRPTIVNRRAPTGVLREPLVEDRLRGAAQGLNPLDPQGGDAQARAAEQEQRNELRLKNELQQRNEFQEFVANSVGRRLPLFGYDLFSGSPSTFAPVDRVPVTADYIIGPGDEIVIRAWGQVDIDYRAQVDRNGAIHIPQIGSVTVGGLRYQDLHGYMKSAISRVFRNFELNVSLGQLRAIQVFVVGQARRPGAYTVSSLSTLVNALFASGGPSPRGSMRSIQLRRGGTVVSEFDVYDLLLKGDKSKDVRLAPGDVIYIPAVGDLVAISGSVNQPAIYELKNGTTIGDLIQLAGGLSAVAAGQKVKVERIVERRARQIDEFELNNQGLARGVHNGDLVQIYALSPRFDNAVTLRGAVANPGRFPWRDGMTVRDLIPNQDALIVPDYWQRLNRSPRILSPIDPRIGDPREGERFDDPRTGELRPGDRARPPLPGSAAAAAAAFDRAGDRGREDTRPEQRLGDSRPPDLHGRVDMKRMFDEINWDYAVVERLNPTDLTTMLIPFNLGRAILDADPSQNLTLRPGDVVTILSRLDVQVPVAKQTQFVRLEGEVRTPGIYQLLPGETLRQLVSRVGGFTPNAYVYGAELTRESLRIQQQRRLDEATDRMSQEVERAGAGRAQASLDDKDAIQAQIETQRRLIQRLREIRATGRIVLEVPPDRTEVRDLPELALEDGDRFLVPSRPFTVGVIGSVYNQTAFVYDRDKRVSDYLHLAGGLTPGADKGRTYVVRADGSVTGRVQSSIFNFLPGERVNPGDTIVVPENLERFFLTKTLKDWTQIFSQFALGVAALKVLKDF